MKSSDGKALTVVTKHSREFGDLIVLIKEARNAVVWVRDDYTKPIIDGLKTIQKGETVKVGVTDDGRVITLISSVKVPQRGERRGEQVEVISFVLSKDESSTGGRNVLGIGRDQAPLLAAALSAESIPAARLVARTAPQEFNDQADLLADPRYAGTVTEEDTVDLFDRTGLTCPTCDRP